MKIAVIGGGTGTYTALTGLKNYTSNLTAVVTMADSGGSSGILRDEFGVLPPGDVTRCLVALSNDSGRLRELFDYRFNGVDEKHKLGNLIMTALEKITGNPAEAIKEAAKILSITGRVVPVTIDRAHLYAELEDGQIIMGESNIDIPKHNPNLKIKRVWLEPKCYIYRETSEALLDADAIIIGPGDLYTSIIPNLVVSGMPDILRKSKAKKIYICNIMTKHGETNNFKASDFVYMVEDYIGQKLDYIICNSQRPDSELMKYYTKERSFFVEPDLNDDRAIVRDMLSDGRQISKTLLRHDPQKLARAIMGVL